MPPETFLRMAEDRTMPKARDLVDNFNDNVKDSKWSAAHVELVQPLRAAEGAETHFLAENGTNSVSFRLEEGNLKCMQSVSGIFTVVEQVPYDAKRHRWLRLRERAGSFFWDASEDGSTWTSVSSKPTPVTLSSVTLKFQVGITETVPSPGTAIFDNFNVSDTSQSRRIEERRRSAREIRVEAAGLAEARPHPEHANNNDEVNSDRPFAGNYSKSLQHDSLGQAGPYVSQFLLKGNVDPRKPDGQGRDADEGFITYGAQVIDQRVIPATQFVNHLKDFPGWLSVQNGTDTRGQGQFDLTARRFIYSLRFGTTYVHFDQVLNAFYNAAWILMSEPLGNQLTPVGTAKPLVNPEFPKGQGNPYDPPGEALDSKTQTGFATFGPIHLLQTLGEVLGRSLRAVWWQKWGVHRRLRPEEYGGRVHNHLEGDRTYSIHPSILDSLDTGALSPYFGNTGEAFPTYLLPQAYAEGSPTHPAYGAGHATGAGACATILKAFFDESKAIESPLQPAADGLSLQSYTGTDAANMTVGGELNKLAGNIALFRDAAGVHWRSDYTESLPFGEAIAIKLLQEMTLGFNEDDAFFELTRFDGKKIRIFDGKVAPVE